MKNLTTSLFIFTLINCTLFAQNTISGEVNCVNGSGMEGVTVELFGGTIDTLSVLTDEFGNYTFNNVPSGEDYTVFIEKDGDVMDGVSVFDLLLIDEVIAGVSLGNPFFYLAADFNRSGSLTTYDLVLIYNIIMGIDDTIPYGPWRFVTEDFDCIFDTYFPPSDCYMNHAPIVDLQSDLTINFIGVHAGDVNSSAAGCN